MRLQYIIAIWFTSLSAIVALLISEYLFFRNNNLELINIKNEYQTLVLEMKDLIIKKKQEINDLEEKQVQQESVTVKSSTYKSTVSPRKTRVSKARNIHNDISDKVLKEPIFIWPLEKSQFWISSRYGPRKKADGSAGFHLGLDLAASRGTLVKAVGSGVIIESGYATGYGNTVVISHNNRFKTRYAHLDKIFVKIGQKVSAKEYIGQVGSTGSVRTRGKVGDPSHLHFEVYLYNKQVNPLYFLA